MAQATMTLYGIHTVEALLRRQPETVLSMRCQDNRQDKRLQALVALAKQAGVNVERCGRDQLNKAVGEQHQGVVARCRMPRVYTEQDLDEMLDNSSGKPLILLLDGVAGSS